MDGTDGGGATGEGEAARAYTITELTREFDVTTRTLRFYEDEGMLRPVRRGRTRLYRPADRIRLKLILRCKRLGFSLADIRGIIDMYSHEPAESDKLRALAARIRQHRADLQQKQADIAETLSELDVVEAGCLERLRTSGETA